MGQSTFESPPTSIHEGLLHVWRWQTNRILVSYYIIKYMFLKKIKFFLNKIKIFLPPITLIHIASRDRYECE